MLSKKDLRDRLQAIPRMTQNDNESGGPESKRQRRYERQAPKVISPSDPQSAWTG
jgi:hypothetical protein